MKKPEREMTRAVTFRMTPDHWKWLHELAEREDRSITGWLRRQIKIAAQCANLEGVLIHKQKEELSE